MTSKNRLLFSILRLKGLVIGLFILVLSFYSVNSGTIGVGLSYNREALKIDEFHKGCVDYGIYNPFDTDINATVEPSDPLKPYLTYKNPEVVFPEKLKGPIDKKVITLCFKPKIIRLPYFKLGIKSIFNEETPLKGFFNSTNWIFQIPFMPTTIKGTIVASQVKPEGTAGGTGATVNLGVGAPLELVIGRKIYFFMFLFSVVVIIILIVAFFKRRQLKLLYLKKTGKTEEQKREKMRQLQEQMKKMQEQQDKLQQQVEETDKKEQGENNA